MDIVNYFSSRRKEVMQLPWVDAATHNQRLRGMPSPVAFIWDECHPAAGPPGWDQQLYWPWENVRLLLTFVPSRMRTVPDRAVVIMFKPMHLPPPNVNPLGLRPVNLQRLMSYCCGSAQANSCPIGERLVSACSHCLVALSLAAVFPGDPGQFRTTHRDVRLLDRKNPQQMNIDTVAEVS